MKVILTQNVQKLGKAGDVKEVADGFARNMLIPKGAAIIATPETMRALEFQKELKMRQAENNLEQAEKIVEKLDGREIIFTVKAHDDGKIFGSITEKNIIDKFKEIGFSINKKQVKLKNHIKNIGEYNITINFDHGLEAQILVVVEREEQEA